MDPGYICDAKYGPWTFNMIFKDLQETKKALEVLTQERDTLKADLVRWQNPGTSRNFSSEELEIMRRQGEDALRDYRQLQEENTHLRVLLEGYQQNSAEKGDTLSADVTMVDAWCSGVGEARHDANLLQIQLGAAQVELNQRLAAYDELQEKVGEWKKQAEKSDATCEEQRQQIAGLQEQKKAESISAEHRIGELEARLAERDDETRERSREVAELQEQLNSKGAERIALVHRTQGLEAQLVERDEDARKQSQKVVALLAQKGRKQVEFDQMEHKLRQEFELVKSNYKAALEHANSRNSRLAQAVLRQSETAPTPAPHTAPSAPPVVDKSISSPQPQKPDLAPRLAPPSPPALTARGVSYPRAPKPAASVITHATHLNAGQQTSSQPSWPKMKEFALENPCFSITAPHAPTALPKEFKKLFASGSTVLSYPDRVILSQYDDHVLLLAPLFRCKFAAAVFDFGSRIEDLFQMVGATKEVFHHSIEGISYLGTFRAFAVSEVTQSTYADLPKATKEAIVRDTFTSKAVYDACPKVDVDRLRNWYLTGKGKVQLLTLRFVGFNEPLYVALKAHASKTGCVPQAMLPAVAGTKRAASEDVASSSEKKLNAGL